MPTLPTQAPAVPLATGGQQPGQAAYQEGRRLLAEGRSAEALPLLARAVSEAPEVADYRAAYAQALWDQKQTEKALAEAGEAARLRPGFRLDYARLLAHAGRNAQAAQVYEAILVDDPNNTDALREAGGAYAAAQDFANALESQRRATRSRGGDPEAWRGLGWALEKTGDTSGAMEAYQRALRVDPRTSNARARLAELLYVQGRKEDAVSLYREGLVRDSSPVLYRDLGSLLDRMGRPQEAAAAYREYAKRAPNADDAKGVLARANRLGPQPMVSPAPGS